MNQNNLEIILFYVNDQQKKLENILEIFKVVNKTITPAEMFEMCVWSIKKTMPFAQITLFTDKFTNIHGNLEGIKIVRFDDIAHDRLMFDLQRIRMEYLKKQIELGICKNYIFTDIDVIFNRNMEHIFNQEFDIACPATFHEQKYSPRGIPYESLMSIINGGLWFIKSNFNVIIFYEKWLKIMLDLAENDELVEYGKYADMVKKDFLKWWGEPHSLMIMFANEFASGNRNFIQYDGIQIKILDENLYNFAPDIIHTESGKSTIELSNTDFNNKYLFHFRGGRKLFMSSVAKHLGYTKK